MPLRTYFAGTIPRELLDLHALKILNLPRNALTGESRLGTRKKFVEFVVTTYSCFVCSTVTLTCVLEGARGGSRVFPQHVARR